MAVQPTSWTAHNLSQQLFPPHSHSRNAPHTIPGRSQKRGTHEIDATNSATTVRETGHPWDHTANHYDSDAFDWSREPRWSGSTSCRTRRSCRTSHSRHPESLHHDRPDR